MVCKDYSWALPPNDLVSEQVLCSSVPPCPAGKSVPVLYNLLCTRLSAVLPLLKLSSISANRNSIQNECYGSSVPNILRPKSCNCKTHRSATYRYMGPFDKAALMEKVRLRLELTPRTDRVQSHIQQVELYISRNLISLDLRSRHL